MLGTKKSKVVKFHCLRLLYIWALTQVGSQWLAIEENGKSPWGSSPCNCALSPRSYLHRLQWLLRINKAYSWGCLLITVRPATAWDWTEQQQLPHHRGRVWAPSATPPPRIYKVQHKGHQPFPTQASYYQKSAISRLSSTQPNAVYRERYHFGHLHES